MTEIYMPKKRDMAQFIISEEQKKKNEEFMNTLNLRRYIIINKKEITTIGEIKKYLKKIKHVEKLEDYLDDCDYEYLYKWLQFKLMGEIY